MLVWPKHATGHIGSCVSSGRTSKLTKVHQKISQATFELWASLAHQQVEPTVAQPESPAPPCVPVKCYSTLGDDTHFFNCYMQERLTQGFQLDSPLLFLFTSKPACCCHIIHHSHLGLENHPDHALSTWVQHAAVRNHAERAWCLPGKHSNEITRKWRYFLGRRMNSLLPVQSHIGWTFHNGLFSQDVKQLILNGRMPNASGQICDAGKKFVSSLCKRSVHALMNLSYYI